MNEIYSLFNKQDFTNITYQENSNMTKSNLVNTTNQKNANNMKTYKKLTLDKSLQMIIAMLSEILKQIRK